MQKELEQYQQIMKLVEDKIIPNLESMIYGLSPAERDFKTYTKIGLVVLLGFMIVHSWLKYKRLEHLKWMPNVECKTIPDFIKVPINMIEREIAPSLLVIVFLMSVGCFYFF